MRIAINCRSFLTRQYTGVGRYSFNLVRSLLAVDQENEYLLYSPMRLFDAKRKAPAFSAANAFVKIDRFNRGVERTVGPIDIYHAPSYEAIPRMKARVVVTIHDLVYKAYPAGHTDETIRLTDEQIKSFLPHAAHIICCSENTRKDLQRFFSIDKKKTSVIYQGVDKEKFYAFHEDQRKAACDQLRQKGVGERFILFVGTIEPRKNLQNLLVAFSQLKQKKQYAGKLVIAGMLGWKSEGWAAQMDQLGIRDDVMVLGFVDDDTLRALYNLTDVFVFPSFYEGFGYPLIEAMSCGAAVVSSGAAACPEVAGEAAEYINPNDPGHIVMAIRRFLEDRPFQSRMRQKALERARAFSFESTARQTLKVYEELVK